MSAINKLEREFLKQSNAIESEYDEQSLKDAITAWQYIKSIKGNLCALDVKQIHYLLMINLRPDIAGQWRNCAVRIGGHIKKQEPALILDAKVENVLTIINNAKVTEKNNPKGVSRGQAKALRNAEAKSAHVHFEDIHPFEDGNGRVGRILWQYHRLKLHLPIHVIHADFDILGYAGEQGEYYSWFR